MWQSDRNRIACITKGSIGVTYNAIRPGTGIAIQTQRDNFQAVSDRQQSVIWLGSIAVYKMLIGNLLSVGCHEV